jgi:hypothetical protein
MRFLGMMAIGLAAAAMSAGQDPEKRPHWLKPPAGEGLDDQGLSGPWRVEIVVEGKTRAAVLRLWHDVKNDNFTLRPESGEGGKTGYEPFDELAYMWRGYGSRTFKDRQLTQSTWGHTKFPGALKLTVRDWSTVEGVYSAREWKKNEAGEFQWQDTSSAPVVLRRLVPQVEKVVVDQIEPGEDADYYSLTVKGRNLPDGYIDTYYPADVVRFPETRITLSFGESSFRPSEMKLNLKVRRAVVPGPQAAVILGKLFPNFFIKMPKSCAEIEAMVREREKAVERLDEAIASAEKVLMRLLEAQSAWRRVSTRNKNPVSQLKAVAESFPTLPVPLESEDVKNKALEYVRQATSPEAMSGVTATGRSAMENLKRTLSEAAQVEKQVAAYPSDRNFAALADTLRRVERFVDLNLEFLDQAAETLPPPPPSLEPVERVTVRPWLNKPVINDRTIRAALPSAKTLEELVQAKIIPDKWVVCAESAGEIRFASIPGKVEAIRTALADYLKAEPRTAETQGEVHTLSAALAEADWRLRYEAMIPFFSKEGFPAHVDIAQELDDEATKGCFRFVDLLTRLRFIRSEEWGVRTALYPRFTECLIEKFIEQDQEIKKLREEFERLKDRFATQLQDYESWMEGSEKDLAEWWRSVDRALADLESKSLQTGAALLDVQEIGRESATPWLDALVKGVDQFVLVYASVNLLRAIGPYLKREKTMKVKDAYKELEKNASKYTSKLPKETQAKFLDDLGPLFGKGDEAAEKAAKYLSHLEKMGLGEKQIQRVIDIAKKNNGQEYLDSVRKGLQDVQSKYGDVYIQSVGTGSVVDDYLRGGPLPSAKDWNVLKNDYDVSIYISDDVVRNVMKGLDRSDPKTLFMQKKIAPYLEKIGIPPGTAVDKLPAPVQRMVAEMKVIEDIEGAITKQMNGIPPLAFDNMWFRGMPTKASREEYLGEIVRRLPADEAKRVLGSNPEVALSKMIEKGKGSDFRRALDEMVKADPQAAREIENLMTRAAAASEMKDLLSGRIPFWKISEVTGDGAFVTVGGKKLVEMMQSNPFTKIGKEGLSQVDDAARMGFLQSTFRMSPADGMDIVTEMRAFYTQNAGKAADKISKYYLRAAFGRLATDAKIAPELQAAYSALKGSPEERMLMLIADKGKHLFGQDEMAMLAKAWKMKYNNKESAQLAEAFAKTYPEAAETWSKIFKGKFDDSSKIIPGDEAKKLMAQQMEAWHKHAAAVDKALGSNPLTQQAHDIGRMATLGRLEKEARKGFNPGMDPAKWNEISNRIERMKGAAPRQFHDYVYGGADAAEKIRNAKRFDPDYAGVGPLYALKSMVEAEKVSRAAEGPDPTVLGSMMDLFNDPRYEFARDMLQNQQMFQEAFGEWSGVLGRLVWAVWNYVKNPAGFIARLGRQYYRGYFVIDWKRHEQLAHALIARLHGLIMRLDILYNPGNRIRQAVEFRYPLGYYHEVKDRDPVEWLKGRPDQFRERLSAAIKKNETSEDAKLKKKSEVLRQLMADFAAWENGLTRDLGAIRAEKELLDGREEAASKFGTELLDTRFREFTQLRLSLETLHQKLSVALTHADYEDLSAPHVLAAIAGVFQWTRTLREQMRQAAGAAALDPL